MLPSNDAQLIKIVNNYFPGIQVITEQTKESNKNQSDNFQTRGRKKKIDDKDQSVFVLR